MNLHCFFIVLLFCVSCASVSERGQAITIINGGNGELVSDCKKLTVVKGHAIAGWGNAVGLKQAHVDAKNKAGEVPDADTMVIASAIAEFSGGEVTGIVYNCKEKRVQLIQNVGSATAPSGTGSVFKQAKKCQVKGGVWMNDQCVLDID